MGNALQFVKVGREVPDVLLQKAGRVPAVAVAEVLENEVKHSPRYIGARGPQGIPGETGRRGRRGGRGVAGEHGPIGPIGITGPPGDDGEPGKDGAKGPRGGPGLQGRQGVIGPKGDTGPPGPIGPVPRHKWKGTRLSFELPNGTFGRSVELQGPGGGRGPGGRGAREQFTDIVLNGTDLEFQKGGALGPDIVVDLSPLTSGGGLQGLGEWRYQTTTTEPPPSGRVRFDNATIASATTVWIHDVNFDSADVGNFLNLIETGDLVYIQDTGDSSAFVIIEVGGVTDDGTYVEIAIAAISVQGTPFSNNDQVTIIATVAGGVSSVVTGLTTAVDGSDITLTQTSGGSQVADTSGFLWKPGLAGGQLAHGGTAALDELQLRGSTNAALGRIRMQSGVIFDSIAASTAVYAFDYNATEVYGGAFIGGGLNMSGDITTGASTFIYESFRGAPIIRTAVAPGFAAYTVLQALPNLRAGSAAGLNPLAPLILNAGPNVENPFAGTKSVATSAIINGSPTVKASLSGAVMNVTNLTGMTWAPKYSTVAGSTISFGTIRGLYCTNPAVGLFQPGSGVESMTAYYGVDVAAISFGGNVPKAALRSAIAAATNARFLDNIGTAESDFGAGDIHLDDGTWVKYGNTLASPDMANAWAAAENALSWSTFWGVGGNPLYLEGTAADEWIFRHHSGGTLDIGIGFDVNAIVFGTTAPTPNSNNWFVQFAAPNQRQVQIGGEYSDVLWTAGGSIDVNGLAVSDLQAFKINSPAVILNGGTISDISNLFVQAMPSFGATRTQALRVLGRGRIDGHINQGSQSPAQLTANTNDWQLGANNNQRGVILLTTDGSGPYNVTGIDASFGYAQTGDIIEILNVSADTITFTNQDVLSLAANRIITTTGAGIAVGPGESIRFWYDDTGTLRWRHIFEV